MNKLHWIFLALITVIVTPSCFIDVDDDDGFLGCVKGRGDLVTEELSLPDFNGIDLNLPAKVYVKYGPFQEVIVEGKQNIIDELEFDVRNGIWEIETDRCVNNIGDMKFFITLPDVALLRISGSGEIISENVLEVADIELLISGSGNMDIALETEYIDARISGSGNMRLQGVADELHFVISGSGNLRAFDLETRLADIIISGSGDADVTVIESLFVKISGSGDVRYRGFPVIDANISGSGRLINAN
jgi:hypothetical protein